MFTFQHPPKWFLCVWMTLCGVLSADVPLIVEYSGRASSGGSPFTGTGSFKFAFVDSAGTTTYWSNDGTSTGGSEPTAAVLADCDDGFYSVYLGDSSVTNMTVIGETVFDNDTLYLRVWFDDGVNGSQQLSPDQLIASTVFAVRAGKADKVADGAITESMLSAALQNKLNATTSSTAPSGMATIPEGEFTMGNDDGSYNQTPARAITLSEYFIETHEVSKDTWDTTYTWATSNGYTFDNAGTAAASTHPVCQLNWYDIIKWCNARSEQEGLTPVYYTDQFHNDVYRTGQVDIEEAWVDWEATGYRLPTEAEWEKAARGGLEDKLYPWGDTIDGSYANYNGSGDLFDAAALPRTTPAGDYNGGQTPTGDDRANGYGLYDVAGNVSEWVWDWYDFEAYQDEDASTTDPYGPETGTTRVIRGGSWGSTDELLGVANRDYGTPGSTSYSGFRCVRSNQ